MLGVPTRIASHRLASPRLATSRRAAYGQMAEPASPLTDHGGRRCSATCSRLHLRPPPPCSCISESSGVHFFLLPSPSLSFSFPSPQQCSGLGPHAEGRRERTATAGTGRLLPSIKWRKDGPRRRRKKRRKRREDGGNQRGGNNGRGRGSSGLVGRSRNRQLAHRTNHASKSSTLTSERLNI